MKELPQLRMRHSLAAIPPDRVLPPGCVLRVADAADADGLARVLSDAFGESWTLENVHERLFDDMGVPLTFMIEQNGSIVATASYQVKPETDPEAGWLHWVGVHPDARGLALGEIVSRRVLSEAVGRGRNCVLLTTDDERLAAIKTYLRLGFDPDPWHPSHAGRWAEIRGVV